VVFTYASVWGSERSPLEQAVSQTSRNLKEHGLVTDDDGWKLSQEWGALQPHASGSLARNFVIPNESTSVDFDARVFR